MSILRCAIAVVLLLAGLLSASAQPAADDTWLTVRPRLADGSALPGKVAIALIRLDGAQKVPLGSRSVPVGDGIYTVLNLTPGSYEVTVFFPEFDLVDTPRRVEIQLGANVLDWVLPPIVSVPCDFRREKTPVAPKSLRLYLQAERSTTVNTLVPTMVEKPRLLLFAGTYHLLLLTDVGYAEADLVLKAEKKEAPQTFALQSGGMVAVTVTNSRDRAVPNASITLTRILREHFPLSLFLTAGDDGRALSPPLPPGVWKWTAAARRYRQDSETVTVVAGETAEVEVSLLRE